MLNRELNLKADVVIDGEKYMLSTVDLVLEHIGGRFETMLFPYDGDEVNWGGVLYYQRYCTKEEAVAEHNELLKRLQNGEKFWE